MKEPLTTIEVVQNFLSKQLQYAFLEGDIPIDCTDKFNDLSHVVIFATQKKRTKKSKTALVECSFSYDLNLNINENGFICPEFLLRLQIENDPNGVKYGNLRSLARRVFSIAQNFSKELELPLIMVPFEAVYSDTEDEFVLTQLPKFEHLKFDLNKSKKFKTIDEFYEYQMKGLQNLYSHLNSLNSGNNSTKIEETTSETSTSEKTTIKDAATEDNN